MTISLPILTTDLLYTIVVTVVLGWLFLKIVNIVRVFLLNQKYKRDVEAYISSRNKRLDAFLEAHKSRIPESKHNSIISSSLTQLRDQLRTGSLTSEEIIIAYGIRLATVGRRLNLIADIDLEQSLELARQKDLERKNCKNPSDLPPLHGLPMTIKDHLPVKGLKDTLGYASRANIPPADHNCSLIEQLREKGAIPLAKSNVPMGLVSMESNNRVFGATKNPFDETRSCGGSTGGEGGLIAARCSPIGIGTDLAGSLRLPAGYCGIYSFMPTMARHNLYGMILTDLSKVLYRGTQKELNSAIGPMGRSVDDLILVLQQYLGHVERNPLKSPMKWDQTVFENTKKTRNLKIAYILDDEFCETAPGVRKIVKEVVEKLKAQGHTVQEFPKLRNLGDFLKVGLQLMFAPGVTKGINIGRKEEYVAEPQKVPQFLDSLPEFLKRILEKILKAIGEVRGHFLFDAFYKMSVTDVLKCSSDKEMLKEKFYNTWIENKYDVIINPVLPCVAVPNGLAGEVGVIIQHTILYNLLEFCAGCVPIRALKEDEQGYETRYKDRIAKGLEKVMKNSKGLPVAIQVAAPAYQDEKALAVMKIIEEAFNYHPYDSLKL